jgi:hypothetical protein
MAWRQSSRHRWERRHPIATQTGSRGRLAYHACVAPVNAYGVGFRLQVPQVVPRDGERPCARHVLISASPSL